MAVWAIIILLVAGLAAAIIAPDITGHRDFNIPRYASACQIGDRVFVLYQDYRTLHASVAMVEFGPGNRTVGQKVLVSGLFDCARPKAFPYNGALMVSWLQLHDRFSRFCYARYDLGTGRLGSIAQSDVQATAEDTDHSFDGRNFTLATIGEKRIRLTRLDVELHREYRTTLGLNGTVACLDQNGSRTYFGVDRGGSFTLYYADFDRVTEVVTRTGELREVRGSDDFIAYLAKTGRNRWGEVGLSNGNRTATGVLNEEAYGMVLLPRPNGMFLAWSEWMENPGDDEEEDYEVKLAFVFNLSFPAMEKIRTVSVPDGEFSTNAAMVGTALGGRLFWLDASEGYSMWSADFTESRQGRPSPILSNGGSNEGLSLVVSIAVGMATLFAMVGLIIRGNRRPSRHSRSSRAPRLARLPGTGTLTAPGRGDTFFVVFNRAESYLFLRFFLPGLAMTATILLLILGVSGAIGGSGLGFRIGYPNIILLAVTAILSSGALMLLRQESGASPAHRAGYVLLAIGTAVALSGLLFYHFARATFNPDALVAVRVAMAVSLTLAMSGPSIILYGLSRKSGYLVPAASYSMALLCVLFDIGNLRAATFFPSNASPSAIAQEVSGFILIFLNLLMGAVLGIFLFMELKLSNIKDLKYWTRAEVDHERRGALVLSLLLMSPGLILSMITVGSISGLAGAMDSDSRALIFVVFLMLLVVSFYHTYRATRRDRFTGLFKRNPSGAIYGAYCRPAIYSVVVMMAVLFAGPAGFLVLLFYVDGIRRAESAVRSLRLEDAKASTADDS